MEAWGWKSYLKDKGVFQVRDGEMDEQNYSCRQTTEEFRTCLVGCNRNGKTAGEVDTRRLLGDIRGGKLGTYRGKNRATNRVGE